MTNEDIIAQLRSRPAGTKMYHWTGWASGGRFLQALDAAAQALESPPDGAADQLWRLMQPVHQYHSGQTLETALDRVREFLKQHAECTLTPAEQELLQNYVSPKFPKVDREPPDPVYCD